MADLLRQALDREGLLHNSRLVAYHVYHRLQGSVHYQQMLGSGRESEQRTIRGLSEPRTPKCFTSAALAAFSKLTSA